MRSAYEVCARGEEGEAACRREGLQLSAGGSTASTAAEIIIFFTFLSEQLHFHTATSALRATITAQVGAPKLVDAEGVVPQRALVRKGLQATEPVVQELDATLRFEVDQVRLGPVGPHHPVHIVWWQDAREEHGGAEMGRASLLLTNVGIRLRGV